MTPDPALMMKCRDCGFEALAGVFDTYCGKDCCPECRSENVVGLLDNPRDREEEED